MNHMHLNKMRALGLSLFFSFLLSGVAFADGAVSISIPDRELCAATSAYSPFAFDSIADSLIATAGISTTAVTLFLQNNNDFPRWNGTLYDASTVNVFDRWAMMPYNKTIDTVATVSCGLSLAVIPGTLFATEALLKNLPASDFATTAIMYAESFLLSYGIKGLLKTNVLRVRPYMYFDGYPTDALSNSDFEFSFPSGHTTNAFLGAVFTSCVFAWYYPTSAWRIPITCVSLGIACATGVMRVMSGNHFVTDVLAGAALGSLCGFVVPFVHHLIAEKKYSAQKNETVQKFATSVSPFGVNFKLYL